MALVGAASSRLHHYSGNRTHTFSFPLTSLLLALFFPLFSASRPHSGNRAFQADVGSRDLARLWGNAALLMPRADVVFTHDIFP